MRARLFVVFAAVLVAAALPFSAAAEGAPGDDDVADELKRQTDELELDGWDEYLDKVRLAKYLGVSRQMLYNYLATENLEEWPSEKATRLMQLLEIKNLNPPTH